MKKEFADYYDKSIDFAFDDSNPWTALNQGAKCCSDKHPTFYGTVTSSPQWKAWYDEQMRRFGESRLNEKTRMVEGEPMFDIDETIGIGAISQEHFQEFLRFVIKKQ